jgi:hypothetical protein
MPLRRSAIAAALIGLFVLAGWMRLRGLDSMLPHWTYPDGYMLLSQLERTQSGAQNSDGPSTAAEYPYLVGRVAAALLAALVGTHAPVHDLEGALEDAREPWMRLRLASVLLSLLAVPATYGIARRFLSARGSLLAVACVAFSLLHVSYSSTQRPHGAAGGTVARTLAWRSITSRAGEGDCRPRK